MSLRHAWSLLPLSTPSNYLHHTLQPTQQRERGLVVMMEEVRTKQQLIHQLNIWPHYQKSSNCKLKKGWHVGHLFREYEIVECLFRGSVSHWSSSKTSRTKLFFFFHTAVCSVERGLVRKRNYFQMQVISFSHTFLKQPWNIHSCERKIELTDNNPFWP